MSEDQFAGSRGPDGVIGQDADYLEQIADARMAEAEEVDAEYACTLTFRLGEPVTPEHLAQRVAEACFQYGALRPGEGVVVPDGSEREIQDTGAVVPRRLVVFTRLGDLK